MGLIVWKREGKQLSARVSGTAGMTLMSPKKRNYTLVSLAAFNLSKGIGLLEVSCSVLSQDIGEAEQLWPGLITTLKPLSSKP